MSVPAQIPISGPYIANGSTTQFAYKFYLLFATDMLVYVGGKAKVLNKDYTVTGTGNSQGGNVVFTTAPANGLEVLIKRATPYTRQTSYADNGDLLASVVNDDFDRIWLALQEINASFSSSISKPVGGNWDAQSLRITNVSDGTQPQDAVTLNQLNTVNGSAAQSAAAAASSASAAKASETNAAASQQAAAGSASQSSSSAGNSADSASLAQKWASNPLNTEVVSGKFSALHYASKASDSAAAASASAGAASTSADNASGSATAAAQSAAGAKSDADRAQSANPDNQLKKANNLKDVADASQALAALGGLPLSGGTMKGALDWISSAVLQRSLGNSGFIATDTNGDQSSITINTSIGSFTIKFGSMVVQPNSSGEGTIYYSSSFSTRVDTVIMMNGDNNLNSVDGNIYAINFNQSRKAGFDYHAVNRANIYVRIQFIAIGR